MSTGPDLRDAIRRLATEARERAQAAEPDDAAPAAPRHWQEAAEEREDGPAPLSLDMGDLAARDSACVRLRRLLGDGAWHSALELVDAGGLRFGARLLELRRGLDGGAPLDVESETRPHNGRRVWFYRHACARRLW